MTDHEKNLEIIRNFRLLDDDFMTVCFAENIECTQLVLRIILGRDDLTVTESHAQYTIKNLQKRSIRLDIFAKDKDGKPYNIEIQRNDKGADSKRARYNSSLIDANITNPGMSFEHLPESYVIFITEHDIFHLNCPVYQFERVSTPHGLRLQDGSHIIYVNGAYQDDSPIGLLMSDFRCTDPKQMHYPVLAERAKHFKENSEGVGTMCKAMEERCKEVALIAAKETTLKNAQALLKLGKLTKEEASLIFNLPLSEVEALINQ